MRVGPGGIIDDGVGHGLNPVGFQAQHASSVSVIGLGDREILGDHAARQPLAGPDDGALQGRTTRAESPAMDGIDDGHTFEAAGNAPDQ